MRRRYDPSKHDSAADALERLSVAHAVAERLRDSVARGACVVLCGVLTGKLKLTPADRRRALAKLERMMPAERYAQIVAASKRP
jgi:hypothetical protein